MSTKIASFSIPLKPVKLEDREIELNTLSFRLVYDKGNFILYSTMVELSYVPGCIYQTETGYPYAVKLLYSVIGTVGRASRKAEREHILLALDMIPNLAIQYMKYHPFEYNPPKGGYTVENFSEFFHVNRPNEMTEAFRDKFLAQAQLFFVEPKKLLD